MHIRRFDRGYSRRLFLEQMGKGVLATGVLAPLWPTIARSGDASRAYPDELLSIEEYTRGKISVGDTISADNVELVKGLLPEIKYREIRDMGRRLKIGAPTTDIYKLSPHDYLEATFRNQGKARFSKKLGFVADQRGKPWIGGNPFPDAKSGLELFAGLTMSWGRHDASLYCIKAECLDPEGVVDYRYQMVWAELATVARVSMQPQPYWGGRDGLLRYQSVIFTSPRQTAGTSFLNTWYYDQHQFPELVGYLPAFHRVRDYPSSQRFEPLVPGSTLFLSDAWAAGDPLYTWGNYKIVGRGPALAGLTEGWNADHPNWEHPTHGGPKGKTFFDTVVEMVPEAIEVEAEPVGYPRAPVGKKRVWFDARTGLPIGMNSYDRKGEPWRSFDGSYAWYKTEDGRAVMAGGHPYWSWGHVHAHDIQSGRMTRLEQVKQVSGGHEMRVNEPIYDDYLTVQALRRMGS